MIHFKNNHKSSDSTSTTLHHSVRTDAATEMTTLSATYHRSSRLLVQCQLSLSLSPLCRIVKFHSYCHPASATPQAKFHSQMTLIFFNNMYWGEKKKKKNKKTSPVAGYNNKCSLILTLTAAYGLFIHLSTINVHVPTTVAEVLLYEMLPFPSAYCIPMHQWELFHITDLYL